MLELTILGEELWDEKKEEFFTLEEKTLKLEHSLVSLSKWESKWCKPFIDNDGLTTEETIDYIRCMTLTQNVDPEIYNRLTDDNIRQINEYIDAPMTASWVREDKSGKSNSERITSELVYYWMISHGIPFECQKWHLNRLLMLIKVCNAKNQPAKKMSRDEIIAQQAALNEARRKQFNSKG